VTWLDVQGREAWHQARVDGRAAVLHLPFPPTANNLFAPMQKRSRTTGRLVMTKRKTLEAKAYAEEVWYHVRTQRGFRQFAGPVAVLICAIPPDRRTRDVMNLEKAITDGIVGAGVMLDDSQVADMRLVWARSAYLAETQPLPIEVSVRELEPHELSLQPPNMKRPRGA
jgi:crossover junction endodeoxyribonuclease RusA